MNHVRSYFARNAPTYQRAARIQARIAAELVEQALQREPAATVGRILELGAGTGHFTERLAAVFPQAQILAIELSAEMIAEHRGEWPNVEWILGDMNCLSPEWFSGQPGFDLVVSNCALHWAESMKDVLRRSAILLSDQGVIAAAVMTRGTLAELHRVRCEVAPEKPPLKRLPSVENVGRDLIEAGLSTEHWAPLRFEQTYASMTDMLEHLRMSAFTGGMFARSEKMLTRSEIQALCTTYQERCLAKQTGITAEFECVLFRASRSTEPPTS